MQSLAFMLPILPGKEQADLEMFEQFQGEERDAAASAHRLLGFTRHTAWHQRTPDGTVAIVLLEAEEIATAVGGTTTSQDPFWRRFRAAVKELHGVDLSADPPPDVRQVFDWRG